ncbi:hypothetical protein K1T71_007958 [Dendrolimus kikuchii]|uniref:Uncharacterized protein n=1 Tax=Dendrolimus kikuchii TaxID=765133 RepID=A0ACC1CYK8_9NEOP|nr:hypothetical protein K1T71_007958 [Dendrolimus kikuchii]
MEFWRNKVAVITGAGRGIGAQIAKDLVKNGMIVIGFEPSEEKFKYILDDMLLWGNVDGEFIHQVCDISNQEQLKHSFEEINRAFGGIDILFNNAVISSAGMISTGNLELLKRSADVNIFGLIACTRLAIESMRKKKTGLIVNVNSICGHYMPNFAEPTLNLYVVSKRAMTILNTLIRNELKISDSKIRITSISPGIVRTDIFGNSGAKFIDRKFLEQNPNMSIEDVSNIVLKILTTPRNVLVKEIIFHALHEIY